MTKQGNSSGLFRTIARLRVEAGRGAGRQDGDRRVTCSAHNSASSQPLQSSVLLLVSYPPTLTLTQTASLADTVSPAQDGLIILLYKYPAASQVVTGCVAVRCPGAAGCGRDVLVGGRGGRVEGGGGGAAAASAPRAGGGDRAVQGHQQPRHRGGPGQDKAPQT